MSILTNQELETLIDGWSDSFVAAKLGVKTFVYDSERRSKYAILCLETLMADKELAKEKIVFETPKWEDSPGVNILTVLSSIKEDQRESYINQYLDWCVAPENRDLFDHALKIASNSKFKDYNLIERIKPHAVKYLEEIVGKIKNPDSVDLFNTQNILDIAKTFGLDTSELDQLSKVVKIFDEYGRVGDYDPENIDSALEIAQNLWTNTKNADRLYELFTNKDFQAKYANNETAREMAKAVIADKIKGFGHHKPHIEKAKELAKAYKLGGMKKEAGEAIDHYLVKGEFECVDNISEVFGYEITDEGLATAREKIIANYSEKIQYFNSRKELAEKLKAFDLYKENGLDINNVPVVILPEGYRGRFMLFEFQDQLFFRATDTKAHGIIENKFRDEIRMYGFRGHTNNKGGGSVGYTDEGAIILSDKSRDYGECDKDAAKKLLEKAFPKKDVYTKRAEGW